MTSLAVFSAVPGQIRMTGPLPRPSWNRHPPGLPPQSCRRRSPAGIPLKSSGEAWESQASPYTELDVSMRLTLLLYALMDRVTDV